VTETNADLDYQRYKGSPLDLAGVKHDSVFIRESFSGFCHICKKQRMVHTETSRCQTCYYATILFPVSDSNYQSDFGGNDSQQETGGMMPTIKEVLEVVHDMRDIFTPRKMLQRWDDEDHQLFCRLKKALGKHPLGKHASPIYYTEPQCCPACSKQSNSLVWLGNVGVCPLCFITVLEEVQKQ